MKKFLCWIGYHSWKHQPRPALLINVFPPASAPYGNPARTCCWCGEKQQKLEKLGWISRA